MSNTEGEVVSIVEPEDESGWRKVETSDKRVGLVPNSYLQLGGAAPAASSSGPQGMHFLLFSRSRKRGSDFRVESVVVLYSYEAGGDDELDLVEGEKLYLTNVGMDYGDGWAEVSTFS
jgi:hypothetical protein